MVTIVRPKNKIVILQEYLQLNELALYVQKFWFLCVQDTPGTYANTNPDVHTTCTLFWIPKRQAIYTDNGFIFQKINENIKERKLSHKPFQSYLLIGQATSAKKAG